ncbi:MAG: hypothetical protein J6C67_03755 [Muribaculaceae bacterium]|nr:hypothetical protein [Muribaculaceae bacterium]
MRTGLGISLGGAFVLLIILLLLSHCSFELPQPREQLGQDGDIRVHIDWDFYGDVDLHVIQPDGEEIYFANMTSSRRSGGGELDVDNRIGGPGSQENAFWRNPAEGTYTVRLVMYRIDEESPRGGDVHVTVKVNGQETPYTVRLTTDSQEETVTQFDYSSPRRRGAAPNSPQQ